MKYKQEILAGFKWAFSNNLLQTILLALQYLILAKYLEPDVFGVMAVLIIIIGLVSIFVEMGIGDAIVQDQEIKPDRISELLLSSLFLGVVAIVISNLIGQFIFEMMDMDNYGLLLFILSLSFLVSPFYFVYSALLEKSLQFPELNKVGIYSFVLGFIATIVLAMLGNGLISLVIGYMVIECSKALGAWWMGRDLHSFTNVGVSKNILPQLKYGSFISGSRFFNYLNGNIDKLLIGKFLGEEVLGFYSVAWNINSIPLRKINAIANGISFPVFSKIKANLAETNKVFDAVLSFVILLNIPIYLLLFFSGSELVSMFFGEKWLTMGNVLEWLSLLGIVKVLSNPAGPLILAKGKSNVEMYWNLFWLVLVGSIVFYCLRTNHDVVDVAKYLALGGVLASPIWHFLILKYTGISYKHLLGSVGVVLIWFFTMFILNRTGSPYLWIINTICSLLCAVSIWYYGEKRGFKLSSLRRIGE